MSQPTRKNLLIICEGTATEPNYFDGLRDMIIDLKLDYHIKISPKPKNEREAEKNAKKQEAREGGRRRQLRTEQYEIKETTIPDDFKQQPTRYVWEAQQGLIDGTYDEAWAVFDLDGHPDHERAFELADQEINGQKIRLAFSSISFETWILLHFEDNKIAFQKSQCRTQKDSHECGQGTNEKDCNGEDCITGYLKIKEYIDKGKDIKQIAYSELKNSTNLALIRALKLRQENAKNSLLYLYNPITTVDRLVFKILHLQKDYKWFAIDQIKIYGLDIMIRRINNEINIDVHNSGAIGFVFQPEYLQLVDVEGGSTTFLERKVLRVGDSFTSMIDISQYSDIEPMYFIFSLDSLTNGITEIPGHIE